MIDLKSRAKNKPFWLGVFSLIAMIGQVFGIYTIPEEYYGIVNTALSLLVGMGVLVDPTTPGIADQQKNIEEWSFMRICIDAGHGGHDSGAVFGNLIEKNINLNVAKFLKEELARHGIDVVMTRENDVYLDLAERSKVSNDNKCDYFVSVHHNAGGGDRGEVIYAYSKPDSKKLAELVSQEFKAIGQSQVNTYYRLNSSGTDYYGVIRMTKAPAIITEFCFLDNVNDNKIVDSIEEQKAQAVAIAKAILKMIGKQYNVPTMPIKKESVDYSKYPVLKLGSAGEYVKKLQELLNKKGYKLTVDGSFGPATLQAVKSFQAASKLIVDGSVGPKTWEALYK